MRSNAKSWGSRAYDKRRAKLIVSAVLDENPGLRAEPVGALGYESQFGVFQAWYFHPGDDHGAAGVGPAVVFSTDKTAISSDREPWVGRLRTTRANKS